MKKKYYLYLLGVLLFFLNSLFATGQLSAPGAVASEGTAYPVFQGTDNIFIFCTENEGTKSAELIVSTDLPGTKTFLWEKYNNEAGVFEFYFSESTQTPQSTISSLEDGCYRATITQGETKENYRAWVFNNWFSVSAESTNSNCESFNLTGSFISSGMKYYDLSENTAIDIHKDIKVEWKEGETIIASIQNPQLFDPPTSDTEYTFRVYDRFGCEKTEATTYESLVTKAQFTAHPQQGEAPLTVTFDNQSENGDPDLYEWFFYRDLDEIKREAENTQQSIDSIMIVAYDENPVFTFENSGTYQVKLVSKNTSGSVTCSDTAYIDEFIVVDTSFVAAPNVFTPNGDGTNDLFVVSFWSMKSIKIQIFNRWGKRIHFWESNDIRGFEETYTETVWDGKLGGRYASPGVYYYVVEGRGRDDKKRKEHGFFHLFRDKQ